MSETTHGITTGAVARRLGVSPTTLRSWDQRYGIGPAAHEGGRHRRWTPGDIAMLEEMCRLTASGVPPAEAARAARASHGGRSGALADRGPGAGLAVGRPGPPRPPGPAGGPSRPGDERDALRESRGLARAAVRLDGPALDGLLGDLMADHGLVTVWEEVMVPTLHAVGRKWQSSGDRYVEVEHLLSWHVSTALRRVAPAPERRTSTPPVLLACVPADQHTLPLEALAAGLGERGLPARMFGAAVPAEALDAAVRRTGPAAVVLWSQARSTADHSLARHIAASAFGVKGARTHPVMLLAGPGWAGRAPGPGTLRPGGLREALDLVSRLYDTF
ncbi:MerR family transcriptional regulator [Streptomyces sp. NBC_01233]|uniref:MerR family transcriptional regulator n=1 Tax=Streptomyces sp. NBC_01233 TaxID=2903787 RepID=UPI002E15B139|nr:cobalamin B12-binding domain-containing protein [Streptomyces sp. NBC_01233]